MGKMRVLVVDDEDEIRRLLCRRLAAEGYDVVEAEEGTGAMRLLREDRIHVVITDLTMPGADGLEIIRHLRRSEQRPAVIVLSGQDGLFLEVARRLGADAALAKPVEFDQLLDAIERFIDPAIRSSLSPTVS